MQRLPECGMAKFMLILPRIPILIPPPKIEIWQGVGTLSLTTQEYHPLLPLKIEIWPEVGTLSFDYPRIHPQLKFGQKLVP